ncbi:MAG: CapA family protein [Gammaproteobacteria bacterium]|nr:CapA family protein [Gammaproteobacteria bacterium]
MSSQTPLAAPRYALALGKAALLCATLFQVGCSGVAPKPEAAEEPRLAPRVDVPTPPVPANVTIAAVGDIMLGTDYPQRRLPESAAAQLEQVAPLLQQADLTFGNLEGVLLDGGEAVKRCSNPSACYLFRSPSSYAATLKAAGFDLLSLANNHARDFGEAGRDATMQSLDAVGIRHSGRVGDVALWSESGLNLAMVAFAPFGGSHDMLDMVSGRLLIEQLAAQSDILIVSFHGGAEGADRTALPFASEQFHGEERGDVVAFAHMAVEAGGDLIIGHGPHVPRALELYQGRLIAYSLGNFATYWGINIRGVNGLAPLLMATLDPSGRFLEGRIHSSYQQRPDGLLVDPQHQAARLIRELTLADFPDGLLLIDDEGHISVKPSPVAAASLGASP